MTDEIPCRCIRAIANNIAVLFVQLLGFPIQLFGLLLLPGAITKYLVDKESPTEDVRNALVRPLFASLSEMQRVSQ